jgi:hypothetical protein
MFDCAHKSRSQKTGETTKLIGIELRCVYNDVLDLAKDPVPQMLKICVRRDFENSYGCVEHRAQALQQELGRYCASDQFPVPLRAGSVQRRPPVLFIEPGIHKESDQASLSISRTRSNKSGTSHTPTDVDSAIQAVLADYHDIAPGQKPDVRPLARRLCECADLLQNLLKVRVVRDEAWTTVVFALPYRRPKLVVICKVRSRTVEV